MSLSRSFVCTLTLSVWLCTGLTPVPASAAESSPGEPGNDQSVTGISTPSPPEPGTPEKPLWHYGGFIDLGYSLDFNFPDNHLFRNRSTTPRVNELDLNMKPSNPHRVARVSFSARFYALFLSHYKM